MATENLNPDSKPVKLILFGDRALEVVLPDTDAGTLRMHARNLAEASASIVRAARVAANDPEADSPYQIDSLLLGGEFLANTAVMLHAEADRIGGL